jgi:hypothetical protein
VIENQQPGSSSWRLSLKPADDTVGQIKGYASATSVQQGESIGLHITVNPAQSYNIDVYRIGWYQGLGGRLMQRIGPLNGVQQPDCPTDSTTGLIACNWATGYILSVPSTWTSGIYLALLTNAQNYQSYIIFAVRDDTRIAPLLYQQSVTTYQAYNNYPDNATTGKSLYEFNSYGGNTIGGTSRAIKVSFDRPYSIWYGAGNFLDWDIYFVRWMERSGYDVSYSTDIDTHANGGRLLNYKGFLSVGHDEYWSKDMRVAAEAARDAGVNLAFFGANAVYWQVRFEPSATGADNRVMICYKDALIDPVQGPTTTVLWRQEPVNRPEQTLIGIQFTSQTLNNGYTTYVVTNSSNWVYENSGFKDGDTVPGIAGYETDHQWSTFPLPDAVDGSYILLSQSPYANFNNMPDWANSSIYQAAGGAWVFGAGTIGWSWGLDNYGDHSIADTRIQKTTANILNRFISSQAQPSIAAPNNLKATHISTDTVLLTWNDTSNYESNFLIERSLDSSNWSILTATLPANSTHYIIPSNHTPATYYYRVKATNAIRSSGYSNSVRIKTPNDLPPRPIFLPVVQGSASQARRSDLRNVLASVSSLGATIR